VSAPPVVDGISEEFDWTPYVRAAAPALGLRLGERQVEATAGWLHDLAALAGPLLSEPVGDRAESAPVFSA